MPFRPNERDRFRIVVVFKRLANQSLSRLHIAKQGSEQHVGRVALVWQRAEILPELRGDGRFGHVERQQRSVILLSHLSQGCGAWGPITCFESCQPIGATHAPRRVQGNLARSRLHIETGGLSCPYQDRWVQLCHVVTMHRDRLTCHRENRPAPESDPDQTS